MSNSDNQTNRSDSEHVDPLIDSLLHQLNETQGHEDENFLSRVENAIDETEQAANIIPLRKGFQWKRPMSWAAGIAAMLTVGLGLTFSLIHLQTDQTPPLQIVIEATSSEEEWDELNETPHDSPRQVVVKAVPEPRDNLSKIREMRPQDLSAMSSSPIAIPEKNDLAMTNSPTPASEAGMSMSAGESVSYFGIKAKKKNPFK